MPDPQPTVGSSSWARVAPGPAQVASGTVRFAPGALEVAPVAQAGFEDALAGVAAMHRQEITNLREENLDLRRHICELRAVNESVQLPEVPPVGAARRAFERLLLEVAEEVARQRRIDLEAEETELAEEAAKQRQADQEMEELDTAATHADTAGAVREGGKVRIADTPRGSEDPLTTTMSGPQGLFRNLVGSNSARELAIGTFEKRLMCQPMRQRRIERSIFKHTVQVDHVSLARAKLRDIVKHPAFNCLCALIIVINSLLIGLSVEWMAHNDEDHRALERLAAACNVFFGVELVMRVLDDGPRFFFFGDDSKGWNTFDFLLVAFSIAEFVISLGFSVNDGVNVLGSVIKTMKMLRIVRLFRVFRFFRELSDLALMVIDAGRSLIWALAMLAIIIYVFACCFTSSASVYIKEEQSDTQQVRDLFGSLHLTVYTLIQTTLGGVSWGEVSDQLIKVDFFSLALFFVYVFFTVLAVLNIITGVFVDNAMELARTQRDFLVQKEMDLKERYVQELRELFSKIDEDCSGTVSIEEINSYFDDPGVRSYFQALGLDAGDAQRLFTLIDDDGSGDVSVDEFIDGCLRLKGQARSIDIFHIIHACSRIETEIFNLRCAIQGQDAQPERKHRLRRQQKTLQALRCGEAGKLRQPLRGSLDSSGKPKPLRESVASSVAASLDGGQRQPPGSLRPSLDGVPTQPYDSFLSSLDGGPRASLQPRWSLDGLQKQPRGSTQPPPEGTQRQQQVSVQSSPPVLGGRPEQPHSSTQDGRQKQQNDNVQLPQDGMQRPLHSSLKSTQGGLPRIPTGSIEFPQDFAVGGT